MAIEIDLIINNLVRRRSVIFRVSSLKYAHHIAIHQIDIVRHILKITHVIIRYFYFENIAVFLSESNYSHLNLRFQTEL